MSKIIPAHTLEANEMARHLFVEWFEMGIPVSCSLDEPEERPTLVMVKNRMAVAFGWDSWASMIDFISLPHEPVYLDSNIEQLETVVSRLSSSIGYDYAHGMIYSLIENSGAGYSPKTRRELALNATPWGQATVREEIADGITQVSTSSHGGILLSKSRISEMPDHLSLNQSAYEEDCEARLVELAFPELFAETLKHSLAAVGIYSSRSVPMILDPVVEEWLTESRNSFSTLFGTPNKNDDSLNREMTERENEAVNYLSKCVLLNFRPIVFPKNDEPTLQDWAQVLADTLRVDGSIPMTSVHWKTHFYNW